MVEKLFRLAWIFSCIVLILSGCTGKQPSNPSLAIDENVQFGKEDYAQIVPASNRFGFDVMHELESDGNLFMSPASLFIALSMIYNGAAGQTQEEMAKTLYIDHLDVEQVNRANASLFQVMGEQSNSVQLAIANSVWLNEVYALQQSFQQAVSDFYNAETAEIDVTDSSSTKQVNDWVRKQTNGKIPTIIDQLPPNLVLLLLNAIYFQGDWTYSFQVSETGDDSFKASNGTVQVEMMRLSEELAYFEDDQVQVVELPYGKGDVRMQLFFPREQEKAFFEQMTVEKWGKWTEQLAKREGTVYMPKFTMEKTYSLNEPLQQLGIQTAFTNADFGKWLDGDGSVAIDEVMQKTYIQVDEKGTEAAAVTSVTVIESAVQGSIPFRMYIDRPFFFTIVHHPSEVILFQGIVENPNSM